VSFHLGLLRDDYALIDANLVVGKERNFVMEVFDMCIGLPFVDLVKVILCMCFM
jgi:hypothetical protein